MIKIEKKNICFIINPISGKGVIGGVEESIEKTIDRDIFNPQIYISEKRGEIEKLTNNSIKEGAEIIVAVGGDGTVNEVAKKIVHTDISLGIIPIGSGNGLANFLDLPINNIEKAVNIINMLRVRKIDTGTINSFFFINVAGIGFDATVAQEYANMTERGFNSYLNASIKKYMSYTPETYKIRFNGKTISRESLLIAFANSNQFGYNTSIAPDAKINDGKFNMCIMKKVPIFATPFVLPMLFVNQIHKSNFHESFLVDEVYIYRKSTIPIQIDGECVNIKDKELHIVNHKQSIGVLC